MSTLVRQIKTILYFKGQSLVFKTLLYDSINFHFVLSTGSPTEGVLKHLETSLRTDYKATNTTCFQLYVFYSI